MNNLDIKEFIIEYDVRKKVIESFWYYFKNYRAENEEEFKEVFGVFEKENLKLRFSRVGKYLRNWDSFENVYNENNDYIEAYLNIEYNEERIGWYSLLFNFSGEIIDDYFVLD